MPRVTSTEDDEVPGSQGSGDFENCFGPMLHPIKDINKNWDVDLCNYLQQYLEQFIQVSDSATCMNFAQAAMLLQGSAHIYSKKVEYVYSLTYRLYEQLASKTKTKQLPNSQTKDGKDADVQASVHEEFVSLDDIPECHNLSRSALTNHSSHRSLRTPVPNLLVMQDDQEKGNSMLMNMKGVQLGNRNDTSLNRFLVSVNGSLVCSAGQGDETTMATRRGTTVPISNTELPAFQQDNENEGGNDGDAMDPNLCDDPGFDMGPSSPPHSFLPQDTPGTTEKRQRRVTGVPPQGVPKVIDLMEDLLDPHAANVVPERPLKTMKVHRLPISLRSQVNRAEIAPLDVNVLHDICYSHVGKFPKNPLKVPLSQAFHQMFWEQHKENLAKMRLRRKERLALNQEADDDNPEDEENDEPFQDMGADLDADSDEEMGMGLNLDDLPIDQGENNQNGNNFDDIIPASQESIPVISTYEELAKEQIAKFHEYNKKYQRGSDMTKRVSEWEEKIMPALDEEESRRPYDIHAYGSEILDSFGDNNRKQTLPFSKIVQGRSRIDIPRYFLSALLLANCYNVEIESKGDLHEGMDTMELTLLSRKRHHEGLEEFRAPSTRK